MKECIESTLLLVPIHNVTVSNESFDPATYAVSTALIIASKNNTTLASTSIATMLAYAMAGVLVC